MNKKFLLIVLGILIKSTIILGQENTEITDTTSFFYLQKQFESNVTDNLTLRINDQEVEDLHGRWQWFWRDRIDKNGEFDKYFKEIKNIRLKKLAPVLNLHHPLNGHQLAHFKNLYMDMEIQEHLRQHVFGQILQRFMQVYKEVAYGNELVLNGFL